jgi:hypothetical protein
VTMLLTQELTAMSTRHQEQISVLLAGQSWRDRRHETPLADHQEGRDCVGGDQPPALTELANRQAPRTSQPGSALAASNAAPIAATANRPASAGGRTGSPPSSTASAANAVPNSPPRSENRRHQPRAVVCGTPARAAAGRTPHARPATAVTTAPTVSAASRRQASTNVGSNACVTLHARHRSRGDENLPAAAAVPDMPPVAGPERHRNPARRALQARELRLPAGRRIRIDPERARPYHGHRR